MSQLHEVLMCFGGFLCFGVFCVVVGGFVLLGGCGVCVVWVGHPFLLSILSLPSLVSLFT
jgi:hypothetical protein